MNSGAATHRLMNVLLSPVVSEKSHMVGDKNNQFVFEVARDSNKREIRRAVELMFKVEVVSVQVCNVKGKRKMFQRSPGRRPSKRKAYVRLKPGFDIDYSGAE
jgi:large subunit ribosomal protein L23